MGANSTKPVFIDNTPVQPAKPQVEVAPVNYPAVTAFGNSGNSEADLKRLAERMVEDSFRVQFTKAPEAFHAPYQPIPVNDDVDDASANSSDSVQPPKVKAGALGKNQAPDADDFVVVDDTDHKANTAITPISPPSASDASVVGNYRLINLLGQGSFGRVYQVRAQVAQHEWQKKDLAMKMIIIQDPRLEQLIKQEIENCSRSRSPFVVEIYECMRYDTTSEKYVCIVMELCSFSLGQLLRSRTMMSQLFPESLIVYLLVTIMEGLLSSHEQNIIHRDIKPDNILLTTDLQIKISDFGISKKLQPHDLAESFIGTIPYMAPEQLSGQKYDTKADVFALGTTLFEVLTCRVITDPNARMWNNIDAYGLENFVRAIPRLYSEDLVYILYKMLAPNPAERASLAELLGHAIFKPWRVALKTNPFQGPLLNPRDTALCEAHDAVVRAIVKDLRTCAKSDVFIMFNVMNKVWIRRENCVQILQAISQRLGEAGIKRSDIEQCTESEGRKQLRLQFFGHCVTCGLVESMGCCFACLFRCHGTHQVFPYMRLGNCYCDCPHHLVTGTPHNTRGVVCCTFKQERDRVAAAPVAVPAYYQPPMRR